MSVGFMNMTFFTLSVRNNPTIVTLMTIMRDAKRPFSIPSGNKQKQNKTIHTQAINTV